MTRSGPLHVNPIVAEDIEQILQSNLEWDKLAGKTVFISGASGFLPAYLVYVLLAMNDRLGLAIRVIGLVRNGEKGKKRFENYLDRPDFQLLVQDVVSPVQFSGKVDFVIHAASQASPKYYGSDPIGTLKANVLGTLNLLDFAQKASASRFLYFSSSEVYGSVSGDKIPTREDDYGYLDPTQVRSCYAESKRMGETICISWMKQYGLPAVIVRPFHTYGPGMELNDGRVYADFIANVVRNEDITMKSDGSAIRAFCYISDATEGFFRVLLQGKAGESYNVGNDAGESSISNLAERLIALFPDKNLKINRFQSPSASGYISSVVSRNVPEISKIKSLGWQPVTGIETGFSRTIRSYL